MTSATGKEYKIGDEVLVVMRFVVEEIKETKDGTRLLGFKNGNLVQAIAEDVEDVYAR